jgi:hypothetical protein
MTISDQIDALQKRAADLKNSFQQSLKETNEQVKAHLATPRQISMPGKVPRRTRPSRPPTARKASGSQ